MHNKSVQCDECAKVVCLAPPERPNIQYISKNNGMLSVMLPFQNGRLDENDKSHADTDKCGVFDFCTVDCLAKFLTNPIPKKRDSST